MVKYIETAVTQVPLHLCDPSVAPYVETETPPPPDYLNLADIDENAERSSVCSDDTLSEYCLKWLFDPTRRDHLPIDEQLQYYKQRDLRKVKIYKLATTLWGPPDSRKRKIVAPPMDSINKRDVDVMPRTAPPMNSELKPQLPPERPLSPRQVAAIQELEKRSKYKQWMNERKEFR